MQQSEVCYKDKFCKVSSLKATVGWNNFLKKKKKLDFNFEKQNKTKLIGWSVWCFVVLFQSDTVVVSRRSVKTGQNTKMLQNVCA